MTGLRIAPNLTLPMDAVTETFAILARKGAGKTYLGMVMAEEFIKAGLPVVIIDPMGVGWGLRAAADGKREGLPVTILGGEHGDVPLEPTGGKLVADLVIDQPGAFVLDLETFESNAAQDRFVTDFAERLYRAKAKDKRPLHLLVDEADSFAPQRPMPGQQRMLGAFESIVRRGRIRGLGVTLITQRPAVLNKNVLTQAECLITLQMSAKQDRAAIDDWVRGNGTPEERDELVASLASLKRGEAWFWSPSWLRIFQRVQVRTRETFDSSRTPTPGETRIEPRRLAEVDLESLRTKMAETIERAKANDPKELQRQISQLRKELTAAVHVAELAAAAAPVAEPVVERVEVPVITPELLDRLEGLQKDATRAWENAAELGVAAQSVFEDVAVAVRRMGDRPRPVRAPQKSLTRVVAPSPIPVPTGTVRDDDDYRPRAGARRLLVALAQFPGGLTKSQAATTAKIKRSGGTFTTYLSQLRSHGLAVSDGNMLRITEAGMDAVGEVAPIDPEHLIESWQERLGGQGNGARRMFDVLVDQYPGWLSRETLAMEAEIAQSGGTFTTYLSKLSSNGLVEVDDGVVRASQTLFMV